MIPYQKDYIVPGDVFADEDVLCIRCGTRIMGLGYKEMPNVTKPNEVVNVAYKKPFGNHRQMGVVLYRRGRETVTYLPCCQGCVKEIDPARDTDQIIRQIVRAQQIEARWAGMPEEAIQGISRQFADAKLVRAMNPQELIEGNVLQEV
jgi:hypothetical protein